jgi:hypothetical protein
MKPHHIEDTVTAPYQINQGCAASAQPTVKSKSIRQTKKPGLHTSKNEISPFNFLKGSVSPVLIGLKEAKWERGHC